MGRRGYEKVLLHFWISDKLISIFANSIIILLMSLDRHEILLQLVFSRSVESFFYLVYRCMLINKELSIWRSIIQHARRCKVVELRIWVHYYWTKIWYLRYVLKFFGTEQIGSKWSNRNWILVHVLFILK